MVFSGSDIRILLAGFRLPELGGVAADRAQVDVRDVCLAADSRHASAVNSPAASRGTIENISMTVPSRVAVTGSPVPP